MDVCYSWAAFVCGSTHGIHSTSSLASDPPQQHPLRYSWLVLQGLGRDLLSVRHAAPQSASAGVSGALLRYHRNQHVILRADQGATRQALVPEGCGGESAISVHRETLSRVYALCECHDGA